ncbi:MAG: helix-turn-helix domain-containing protein, partial [bacterium]|nr:helix-turn-helix domain-containing protein [bacterium]
ILTSDKHPIEIQKLDQRLVSRFCGGVVVDIQEPDTDMRLEILRRKAQERGAVLQEDVLLALAEQISGSIRHLEGMLNQILTIAAAQRITPTKELACSIIENRPQSRKFVSPQEVVQTVCQHFNVPVQDLKSAKRNREIVLPRQIASYVLKDLAQLSLKNIGDLLGGRDHTTILHGIEKIEQEIKTNPLLKNQIHHLRGEILGKTSYA